MMDCRRPRTSVGAWLPMLREAAALSRYNRDKSEASGNCTLNHSSRRDGTNRTDRTDRKIVVPVSWIQTPDLLSLVLLPRRTLLLIRPAGTAVMELPDLSWPAVAALPKTMPIVFPIAALEQHGRHMPVFTDSLLLGEVMRRVKQTPVAGKCLFAPLMWLGNSHHHIDFPGTLSASARVYLDMLKDLANCFLAHGFSRIVFINGHGGNTIPSQQALFELKQEHRASRDLLLLSLTYWDSAGTPAKTLTNLSQSQMGHACEWETSMVLRLAPHLGGWGCNRGSRSLIRDRFRAWLPGLGHARPQVSPATSASHPPRQPKRARHFVSVLCRGCGEVSGTSSGVEKRVGVEERCGVFEARAVGACKNRAAAERYQPRAKGKATHECEETQPVVGR